jgi:hypothetical protein
MNVAATCGPARRPGQRIDQSSASSARSGREAATKALTGQIARWSAYGHNVVPDTSFYIHHKDKLEDADFGPLNNVWQSEVTVLMPMVIVDELDRLKESKDRWVRWRAGYTLGIPL